MLAKELVEGGETNMELTGDAGARDMLSEKVVNAGALILQLLLNRGSVDATGTPQALALGLAIGQGLFGALGDELTLDFGTEGEGKGDDFGLQVVAQLEAVLDGVDATSPIETFAKEVEDHVETSPKAGDLGGDDEVISIDPAKKGSQTPFTDTLGAGDGLFEPAVDGDVVVGTILKNFVTLVLERLLVGGDANVSVGHCGGRVKRVGRVEKVGKVRRVKKEVPANECEHLLLGYELFTILRFTIYNL